MANHRARHSPAPGAPPATPPPPTPPGWQPPAGAPRRRSERVARRRRLALRLTAAVVLLLAVGGAWVVIRGLQARTELAAASQQIPALRQQIVHGDQQGASRALAAVAAETSKARALTSDPVWRAYEKLPWVGRSLRTSSGLAAAADRLSVEVLPPLVSAARVLDPSRLRTGDTIALPPFTAAQPALDTAAARTKAVLAEVQSLPGSHVVGPVAKARLRLLGQLHDLAATTGTAATTAD